MPDPHVQPPGDRLRVQEVADPAQEAPYEEGDPGLGQGWEGQRQGHLPRLRQAQQHDRYADVFLFCKGTVLQDFHSVAEVRDVYPGSEFFHPVSLGPLGCIL